MATTSLTYRLLELGDVGNVKRFLEQHSTERVALNAYLGVTVDDVRAAGSYGMVEVYIAQGNSFGAFDGANLCGVLMNVSFKDKKVVEAFEGKLRPKIRRLRHAILNNRPLDEVLGTGNYWEQKLACVAPKYAGMGVMYHLESLSNDRALEKGIEKLVSFRTYRTPKHAYGVFKREHVLYLPDYVDSVTGEREFAGMKPPYDELCLLVVDLKSDGRRSKL